MSNIKGTVQGGAISGRTNVGNGGFIAVDETLTIKGRPADAKATGDAIDNLSKEIEDLKSSGTGGASASYDETTGNLTINASSLSYNEETGELTI